MKFIFEKIDHRLYEPAPVVGVDEVGRGCLAGPVYAGAVCLKSEQALELLTDSKLLSEKRREEIAPLIHLHHWVGIGSASVEEIDAINILQASFLAMKRALEDLQSKMKTAAGHVLVDGHQKIPGLKTAQTPLIKGDLRCLPISAASIVAKVTRDQLMKEMAQAYPAYGFHKHKGYGSEAHRKVISQQGPCPHHRSTFKGVREFL